MTTKMFVVETFKCAICFLLLVAVVFLGLACDGQEIEAAYRAGITAALKAGDSAKAKVLSEGLAAYELGRNQAAQRKLLEDNAEIFKGLRNVIKAAPKVAQLFTGAQAAMGVKPDSEEAAIPLLINAVNDAVTKGDFDVAPLVKYFASYSAKEKARKADRAKENKLDEEIWKLQKELNQIRKERELKLLKKRLVEERQRR